MHPVRRLRVSPEGPSIRLRVDETRDPSEAPEADPERSEPDRPSSADRLVARVAELRSQIEVIAPADQAKGREALERVRESQERVAALEEMLAKARERENELTTQAVRDRAKLFESDTRISELSSIAARVADAEEARREAAAAAVESERLAAMAKTEAEAAQAEIALLRARNEELESDMAAVAEELAAAALARAEAARMEQERNEARERAQVERRLAAEDRLRAAEAALRATELQHRLRDAERRIVQLTNAGRRSDEAVVEVGPAEPAETTPPWIELQRNGVEDAAGSEPLAEGPATPQSVPTGLDDPGVLAFGESGGVAPSSVAASSTEADEDPAAKDRPAEPSAPAPPLWSASEPAAAVASTADPWAPSAPSIWGSSTPSASEAGATGEEPDVIDLTGGGDESEDSEDSEDEDKEKEQETTFEDRVHIDSADHSGSGWTDAWNLLRGRRKD